jgi:hypothetical protein
MKEEILNVLFICAIVLMLFILTLLTGCKSVPIISTPSVPVNTAPEIVRITATDFLSTGLILSTVLGVIGIGMGLGKLGLSIAGGSIAGLLLRTTLLTYMSSAWFSVIVAMIVLAGLLLVLAGVLIKNKAIQEMIIGIQSLRRDSVFEEEITSNIKASQSSATQNLIQKEKAKLKIKGEI